MIQNPDLSTLLKQSVEQLGLSIDSAILEKMLIFQEKMLETNTRMNLTGIKDPVEAVSKHLVDSLSALVLPSLENTGQPENWLDLGSGGGLPGIPLALARPEIRMGLIDSTQKKASYLMRIAQELGISDRLKVHADRAENLGQGILRSSASVVVSRGFGHLRVLLELAIPLLKIGGVLVAYKGPKVSEEIETSGKAMSILCSKVVDKSDFKLPGTEENRSIVVIKKLSETSKKYPRPVGSTKTAPL